MLAVGEEAWSYHVKIIDERCGEFKIHWLGWHARFDKWIKKDLLLEKNEENNEKQRDLEAKHAAKRKRKLKTIDNKKKGKASKKAKQDLPESVSGDVPGSEIKLNIPGQLHRCLVEDWERVTVGQQLLPLPRTTTVEAYKHILIELWRISYYTEKHDDACRLHPHLPPARMYGAEHLLRLFTKLPTLLAFTQSTVTEIKVLQARLDAFLKWFDENTSSFGNDYALTTTEYRQRLSEIKL